MHKFRAELTIQGSKDYFKLLTCEVKLQLYLGDRFLASRTVDILTSPSKK